jgi:hypothetical protein
MRSGACWERTTSVPRIGANACGYWPTATAQVRECNEDQWEARREQQGGTLRSTYLQDAVKYQVEERSWPMPKGTPSGPDFARMNREGSGGDDLATAIARGQSTRQTWATPAATDSFGSRNETSKRPEGSKHHSGQTLADQLIANGDMALEEKSDGGNKTTGALNPDWVSWLMGWPVGWEDTSLALQWECPSASTACAHLATVRCLSRWLERSRSWLAGLD